MTKTNTSDITEGTKTSVYGQFTANSSLPDLAGTCRYTKLLRSVSYKSYATTKGHIILPQWGPGLLNQLTSLAREGALCSSWTIYTGALYLGLGRM